MTYTDMGLGVCAALLELEASQAAAVPLALPYQRVADTCCVWEMAVAEAPAPAGTGDEIDVILAEQATAYASYATWCDLAMVDPDAAAAQEPDVDLPDAAETAYAHALDDAYTSRNPAATTLNL